MTTEQRIEKMVEIANEMAAGATNDLNGVANGVLGLQKMLTQVILCIRNQQKQIDSLMTVEKDRLDKLVQQEEASNYNPAD